VEISRAYFVKTSRPSTWTMVGALPGVTGLGLLASGEAAINLGYGWNLVSVPYGAPSYTAQGLLNAINAQGGQATEVHRWQAGGWQTHINGLPMNDFVIEPGRGYFIKTSKASTFRP